jgi:HAD superfamily hydrolase (TIGR01509 family)
MVKRSGELRYELVIFDMDGTLTEELLDFEEIRREIGLPAAGGILEHIAGMGDAARAVAEGILHRHEMESSEQCVLQPGAKAMLEGLQARGVRTALLTRNSRACAECVLGRHELAFEFVATREHLPHKPHGDSILNIVRKLGISPERVLMVGDYIYDLQAARAAGVDSALLCTEGEWPPFAEMATYRIRRLEELLGIVGRIN